MKSIRSAGAVTLGSLVLLLLSGCSLGLPDNGAPTGKVRSAEQGGDEPCPDGTETEEFPSHQSDFHHCRPVFETLSGWQEEIDETLPRAAQSYVSFVEGALDVPVTLVGTGAARERVLALG